MEEEEKKGGRDQRSQLAQATSYLHLQVLVVGVLQHEAEVLLPAWLIGGLLDSALHYLLADLQRGLWRRLLKGFLGSL